jgi:hypothetical protein
MAIVQLIPFDLLTAEPMRLMAPLGFWASLPRLTRGGTGTARLLMVADNLRPEDVVRGFDTVAIPRHQLPPHMRWFRSQYEDFLTQTISVTRHMRLYLVMDALMDEPGLIHLLATYGIRAERLGPEGVPAPFLVGEKLWTRLETPDGAVWGVVRSRTRQTGVIHPQVLHRLFALDFPVWASLDIATFTQPDAARLLQRKDISALYEKAQGEAQAEARDVRVAVDRLRYEINRVGAALHTTRLSVMVGAEDHAALSQRLEIVRGAVGMEMEPWEARVETIRRIFSAEPPRSSEGSILTTTGLALLTGSALSYRRRTETRGVLLGTDRNQAPVILNIFDDKNPSYNMVVLGQTGAGKSFAILLLMLRHLLMGMRLVIVDPQGNIDLSFLGEDITHRSILGTAEASINILDLVHEELTNQVEGVLAMMSMLGVLTPGHRTERAVMDQVLVDIYAPLWGKVRHTQVPTLHQVQRRLDDLAQSAALPEVREAAAMLSYALDPYTRGSRSALFGRKTTVDFSLEHPVTVYDVSRLPKREQGGNLRAALLSILVADINQAIRRLRRAGDRIPILFFIDEMGVLMRDDVIASHVSEEYKTARSRRVGMIVADQDLHSLLGPADERGLHHGIPMLANAATTLIFNQKSSEKARVREHFPDLPPVLLETLPVLPQGTCLVQLPDDLLQVNVLPSAFELAVLSSRLQDRARAQQIIQRVKQEAGALAA